MKDSIKYYVLLGFHLIFLFLACTPKKQIIVSGPSLENKTSYELYLEEYGVKSGQDITDVLNSVIKFASKTGKELILPEGYFTISKTINFPASLRTSFRGKGCKKTIFLYNGPKDQPMFVTKGADNLFIENIGFDGKGKASTCFQLDTTDNSTWRNLELTGFSKSAFSLNWSINNTFDRCYFIKNNSGIDLDGRECNVTNFNNCTFVKQEYGVRDNSYSHKTINITGCIFEELFAVPILLNHVFGVNIQGCYFETNSDKGVTFSNTQSREIKSTKLKSYIILNGSGAKGRSYLGINYYCSGINISGNFISNAGNSGQSFIHLGCNRALSVRANHSNNPNIDLISFYNDRALCDVANIEVRANYGFLRTFKLLETSNNSTAEGLYSIHTESTKNNFANPLSKWKILSTLEDPELKLTNEKWNGAEVYELNVSSTGNNNIGFLLDAKDFSGFKGKIAVFSVWVKKDTRNTGSSTFSTTYDVGSGTRFGNLIKGETLKDEWKRYSAVFELLSSGIFKVGVHPANLTGKDKIYLSDPMLIFL